MRRVIDYDVVEGVDLVDLKKQMADFLADSFEPLGAPFFLNHPNGDAFFFQAVLKYERAIAVLPCEHASDDLTDLRTDDGNHKRVMWCSVCGALHTGAKWISPQSKP